MSSYLSSISSFTQNMATGQVVTAFAVAGGLLLGYSANKVFLVAAKYLVAGGTALMGYSVIRNNIAPYCVKYPENPKCEILGYAECAAVVAGCLAIIGVTYKAYTDMCVEKEPAKPLPKPLNSSEKSLKRAGESLKSIPGS